MVPEVFPENLTLDDFEVDEDSFTAVSYVYFGKNDALLSIDLDIDEQDGHKGITIISYVQPTVEDNFKVIDEFFMDFEYQGGSAWHTNDTRAHAKDLERAEKYVREIMPWIVDQANKAMSEEYGHLYRTV